MSGYRYEYVTFLSDYGLSDEFVGVCHGVMLSIAPEVKIIDITHGIQPQNIREGAMILAQSVRFMPKAVHLAIIDPSVGSLRKSLVIETGDGSALVGPDNGLLAMAAMKLGGATACREIANADLMITPPSKTFHGRDIFAPAAAHLAKGVPIAEFGPEVPVASLVAEAIPQPRLHDDHYHAEVLHIDRFGNVQLNVTKEEMTAIGLPPKSLLEVRIEGHRKMVMYGETFSAVADGELVVTEDSYGLLAVAVNKGRAAEAFGAQIGSSAIIGAPGSGAAD